MSYNSFTAIVIIFQAKLPFIKLWESKTLGSNRNFWLGSSSSVVNLHWARPLNFAKTVGTGTRFSAEWVSFSQSHFSSELYSKFWNQISRISHLTSAIDRWSCHFCLSSWQCTASTRGSWSSTVVTSFALEPGSLFTFIRSAKIPCLRSSHLKI